LYQEFAKPFTIQAKHKMEKSSKEASSRKRKVEESNEEPELEQKKKTKTKTLKPWKVNPENNDGFKVLKPKTVTKSSGLLISDFVIGKGPSPKPGATLKIVYECLSPNGDVFDSVLKKKDALSFRKGLHQVVEGLDIGVDGMRIGGAREIIVPSTLG
jgi:FKBP-type peptidyl-prolyl cis-trans isomerase